MERKRDGVERKQEEGQPRNLSYVVTKYFKGERVKGFMEARYLRIGTFLTIANATES